MSPSSTPYVNDFPGSNVASEDYYKPGTYYYFENTTSKMEKKGEAQVIFSAVYDDPQTLFTYPFTYNTVVTDNFSCTTAVGTYTLEKTGTWKATGDGYGTLLLPTGTYNDVLRIKIESYTHDDYIGATTIYELETIEYWWVRATSKAPLFKIETQYFTTNGTPIDTIVAVRISDEISGIGHSGQIMSNIRLYPNPVHENLNLLFELNEPAMVTLELFTADGRLINRYDCETIPVGSHQKTLSLDGMAPGFYLLNVDVAGISRMLKFIRN